MIINKKNIDSLPRAKSKVKNVKVDNLRNYVNHMLQTSTTPPEARQALICLLDEALHASNNYSGFRYLNKDEVPKGHKAGINYTFDDCRAGHDLEMTYEQQFDNTDRTRVRYF